MDILIYDNTTQLYDDNQAVTLPFAKAYLERATDKAYCVSNYANGKEAWFPVSQVHVPWHVLSATEMTVMWFVPAWLLAAKQEFFV